jgi:signal transduction histidine kinase
MVGGRVKRQQTEIEMLAAQTLRLLDGAPADTIPVLTVDLSVNQVDWRQLRRWMIAEASVPHGTDIRFRDPSVWERYRTAVVTVLTVVTAQAVMIVALIVQRVRRRRAEGELRKTQARLRASYERVSKLGRRLIGEEETERARIARDLHDDVGQQLFLLSMSLERLCELQSEVQVERRKIAADARDRIRVIARSLHDLSHRLHPAKLQLLGLVSALRDLQDEFSRAGVAITFSEHNMPARLPDDVTLCLFRIAQAALQNVVNHSAARRVEIRLIGSRNGVSLIIVDDGKGFDLDAAERRGLGLLSMRERLRPIGGTLEIDSHPGAGTRVHVRVPDRADQRRRRPASKAPPMGASVPESRIQHVIPNDRAAAG